MMRSYMYSESDLDVKHETGKLIDCISVYDGIWLQTMK